MKVDYLIVGSGLTGATIARELADAGREVVVVERRFHIGGNVHDFIDEHGIRIHAYGPHYFRTASDRVWEFANRFGRFYPFRAIVKTLVDGALQNWPIARSYIRATLGADWQIGFEGTPLNFEQASLAMMPPRVYEKFVRGYSEKQWGVPASALSASLAKRFDVREDDDPYLMRHTFQGIPENGYADWMNTMLKGIPVFVNWDYLLRPTEIAPKKCLIFTGPIDEYFGFDLGKLKYRGQMRAHSHIDCDGFFQPAVQVNNPDPQNGAHIRTIEWKHMMNPESAAQVKGTTVTREYPFTPSDPAHYEYPFPDSENVYLYSKYVARARSIRGLLICGRLGEYHYYDMDQAIARARVLAARVLVSADCSSAS